MGACTAFGVKWRAIVPPGPPGPELPPQPGMPSATAAAIAMSAERTRRTPGRDRGPGGRARAVHSGADAPGHVLAQLHALALADVPVLLQVLLVRHPPRSLVRTRRGRAAAR